MMEQIVAVTAVAVICMLAGRRWINHGRTSPRGSLQRLAFLTIGRVFDVLAFIALLVILFFLLMSI